MALRVHGVQCRFQSKSKDKNHPVKNSVNSVLDTMLFSQKDQK